MEMTRWDKFLIVGIMLLCVALIFPILNGAPQGKTASVQVKNEEVLAIDLNEDNTYEVEGTLGPVKIEVQDGAVRVSQENSPHHYCSRQGFVSTSGVPIVCLPNETVIKISGDEAREDTVIQ